MSANALPLRRFKVLDLTRARAGPTAVRQLAAASSIGSKSRAIVQYPREKYLDVKVFGDHP